MIKEEEGKLVIECDDCQKQKVRLLSRRWPHIQSAICSNGWDRKRFIQGWRDRCFGCWVNADAAALTTRARSRVKS